MKTIRLLSQKLRWKSYVIIALSMVGAYLASIWPLKLSLIYDNATSGSYSSIGYSLTIFGVLFLAAQILTVFCRVSTDRIIAQYEQDLRNISILKILMLPSSYFAGEVSGELTSRINQAVAGSSSLLKVLIKDLLTALFIGIFMIGQAIFNAPWIIAVLMLSYVIFSFFISWLQIRSQNGIRELIIKQKTKLDGEICQSILYIDQIRFMSAEQCESDRLAPQTNSICVTEKKHHTMMGQYDALKQFIKAAFFVAILGASIYLTSTGKMTAGLVITIGLLFQQLIAPIDQIYALMDEIASSQIKSKALHEILALPYDDVFNIPDTESSFTGTTVDIANITVFTPSEQKESIIHGENIEFNTELITCLGGASGSGKSSLLKGLFRFYPMSGDVNMFGTDLSNISAKQLSSLIFYLPQKPMLFAGSLYENLKYGIIETVDDATLISALKKACIYDELISKSPNVLSIFVDESGKNFSDGQRQRLVLAKMFLRTPKLFVLDEATANIDNATSEHILNNLENYAKAIDAGIVYISHDKLIQGRCQTHIIIENQQAKIHTI